MSPETNAYVQGYLQLFASLSAAQRAEQLALATLFIAVALKAQGFVSAGEGLMLPDMAPETETEWLRVFGPVYRLTGQSAGHICLN